MKIIFNLDKVCKFSYLAAGNAYLSSAGLSFVSVMFPLRLNTFIDNSICNNQMVWAFLCLSMLTFYKNCVNWLHYIGILLDLAESEYRSMIIQIHSFHICFSHVLFQTDSRVISVSFILCITLIAIFLLKNISIAIKCTSWILLRMYQ